LFEEWVKKHKEIEMEGMANPSLFGAVGVERR
jgi:hypothetical protein